MSSGLRDTHEFRFGEWAEKEVTDWLALQPNTYVIPVSMIENGGAPVAISHLRNNLTLPDLLASERGQARWCEVKAKEHAWPHHLTGQERHGVDGTNWSAYREVEQVTGIPGHLYIVQVDTAQLLTAPMAYLALHAQPHQGSTEAYGGKYLVFFDVRVFNVVPMIWSRPPPSQAERVAAAAAAADARAKERVAAMPRCRVCGRPMTVGQKGTHYACAELP